MWKVKIYLSLYILQKICSTGLNDTAKIVYITAIFGTYESRLKNIHEQTLKSDWICFSNNTLLNPNGWEIDYTPYHDLYPSILDNGNYHNSYSVNRHPFNVAKY